MAYSDASYNTVMRKCARAQAAGAEFKLLSPRQTQIKSNKPVIGIDAVRTGCGKSQTSRKVVEILKKRGYKVVAIREPMPYADLVQQECMRFAEYDDLVKYKATVEEREEYEPYIERGLVIYSGVDYGTIIKKAEEEADVIVWDGGNNEVAFYQTDMHLVIADPLRPGHEISYYPGETNAKLADYIIINKEDSATPEGIAEVEKNIKEINPTAKIVHANSKVALVDPEAVRGKRVIIVEDGPTLTHGGMAFGAGKVSVKDMDVTIVDPRPNCGPSLKKVYEEFPHLGEMIPAMGYSDEQLKELEDAINNTEADVVVSGTPIDLGKLLNVNKPVVRVGYELEEKGEPNLETIITEFEEKYVKK
jgi:predicted GTPase